MSVARLAPPSGRFRHFQPSMDRFVGLMERVGGIPQECESRSAEREGEIRGVARRHVRSEGEVGEGLDRSRGPAQVSRRKTRSNPPLSKKIPSVFVTDFFLFSPSFSLSLFLLFFPSSFSSFMALKFPEMLPELLLKIFTAVENVNQLASSGMDVHLVVDH